MPRKRRNIRRVPGIFTVPSISRRLVLLRWVYGEELPEEVSEGSIVKAEVVVPAALRSAYEETEGARHLLAGVLAPARHVYPPKVLFESDPDASGSAEIDLDEELDPSEVFEEYIGALGLPEADMRTAIEIGYEILGEVGLR